jgi:hypothetical protein
MTTRIIFSVLIAASSLISCSTFTTIDYFKPAENSVECFDGFFVNWNNDTIEQRRQVVNKTFLTGGNKVFYRIEKADSADSNPIIGSNHFLSSVILVENNTILISPVFWKRDMDSLKPADFKIQLPSVLKKNTRITYNRSEAAVILTGFSKASIVINGKKFKCLYFYITETWPKSTGSSRVWLNKQYGLVRWIRASGRIDTRILNCD